MDAQQKLDELQTEYHNTEMSTEEYEERLDEIFDDADDVDELDLDYTVERKNSESESTSIDEVLLPDWWPYAFFVLTVLLLVIISRGRALLFLLPLFGAIGIGYALYQLHQEVTPDNEQR